MNRLLRGGLALLVALSGGGPAWAHEVRRAEAPQGPQAIALPQPLALPAPLSSAAELPSLPTLPALADAGAAASGLDAIGIPLAASVSALPSADAAPAAIAVAPAVAPTPVSAQAQLEATASALAPKPSSEVEPQAASTFFDGLKRKVSDAAEMGQVAVVANLAAILPNALLSGPAEPVAMGLLWAGGSGAMTQMLSESRRTVIGGWQASHDQRYRVDPNTGLLRDIRGHKYGSDRYEAYAPGKVSLGERLFAAAVSAGMGLWWVGGDFKKILIYGAVFAATAAAAALIRARRARASSPVPTEEDKAHAARFTSDR